MQNSEDFTVYVLGAGASIGHTGGLFPSIMDFFAKARKLRILGQQNELREFASKQTGKDIFGEDCKINLEDLLTTIEIEKELRSSLPIEATSAQALELIRQLLNRLQLDFYDRMEHKDNKLPNEYDLLCAALKPRDTIISFNWDTLLDNLLQREDILRHYYEHLADAKPLPDNQYLHSLIKLSGIGESTVDNIGYRPPYLDWSNQKGFYLKLHGSIDQFYCSNEGCRACQKMFPVLDSSQTDYRCSECSEQMKLLIVPPVLNKNYRTSPPIRKAWNIATSEISLASRLVIWGYSLPPTDFYVQWLLRNIDKTKLREVAIINKGLVASLDRANDPPGGKKLNRNLSQRFKSCLSGSSSENTTLSLYEIFSDYHEGKALKVKYSGPEHLQYWDEDFR
ncbi:MAG: hypothetical protein KQJ78_26010 [Deltaproteobacteria bacterium]|nr:hypothetical protein [Deltaproteobacteria bacterium]